MARTKSLAILVALALVGAGCGGSAASPAVPSPSVQAPSEAPTASTGAPATAPTASLTPTASPIAGQAALAAQYTAIASQGAVVIAQCKKDKATADGNLVKGKAAAQACLDTYNSVVGGMQAVSWGAVQPQADAVAAAMTKVQGVIQEMATAPDETAFTADYGQLGSAELALYTSANVLRAALGLPPATP